MELDEDEYKATREFYRRKRADAEFEENRKNGNIMKAQEIWEREYHIRLVKGE